jgi:hypothetical protein
VHRNELSQHLREGTKQSRTAGYAKASLFSRNTAIAAQLELPLARDGAS